MAMVTNSARVTRLDRPRSPLSSPAMMPRAVTARETSSTETDAGAARAGAARERERQAASKAVSIRFFIAKTPFFKE